MIKKINKFQSGAAALLAVMVITSGILAVSLSVTVIAMDTTEMQSTHLLVLYRVFMLQNLALVKHYYSFATSQPTLALMI